MIIQTITLHNFMSYADAKLDLTSVDVACLTGSNGAGKSAVLDAITWALWECGRSGSDELVRAGEKEMWVELAFQWEGVTYSVRRSRYKGAAKGPGKLPSKGNLEFKVNTDGNGTWLPLTGYGMRETQGAINKLLRMDYETFVNSVYLRQGKADEFTVKAPADRKDVLSEILGLRYFDDLQEKARDKAKSLKSQMEFLELCLAKLPELDEDLAFTKSEITKVSAEASAKADELQICQQEITELDAKITDFKMLETKSESEKKRLDELVSSVESIDKRVEEAGIKRAQLLEIVAKADAIETEWQNFEVVKSKLAELDEQGLAYQELTHKRQGFLAELMRQRMKLELDLENSQRQFNEILQRKEKLEKDTNNAHALSEQYSDFKQLMQQETDLLKRQEEHTQLTLRAEELKSKLTEARIRLSAELEQKQNAIVELSSLIESSQNLASERLQLEMEASRLDKLEAEFSLIEDKGLKLKETVEKAEQKIAELKRLIVANEAKIIELNDHSDASHCPLCASPIIDRVAVIERYDEENRAHRSEITELDQSIASGEAERQFLRVKYVEIRRELDRRKDLDIAIGQHNEKMKAIERAGDTINSLRAQVADLQAKIENHDFSIVERESLVSVKLRMTELDFDPAIFANLQSQIRGKRQIEFRYHQMQRDLTELEKLSQELPVLSGKVNTAKDQLSDECFGEEIRQQQNEVEVQISELNYDMAEHKIWRDRLKNLAHIQEEYHALENARVELPNLERQEKELGKERTSKTKQMQEISSNLESWKDQLQTMPETILRHEQLKQQANVVQNDKSELDKQIAVLESRQEQLETTKQDLKIKEENLATRKEELSDFQFLAEAFGKKGLQAVIIENAVPEIENEANKILARLSDHKMHLGLITQQETRSGKLVETLDLVVADEVGTRNYELYSGGEAFKVDFSVRVALSRLLSRRAGAKLQTLVIDEGFGSQDNASRERLVQAISSVKNDFARILVITHISEVKDMFPVEIQVSKQNGSSELKVVS
ncbi:MAG: SMC family ATPase [Candidatus Obscuribacterales bacterium]|nr:SMC family ATPase [Candidatus Obscuribacterales bacterium]